MTDASSACTRLLSMIDSSGLSVAASAAELEELRIAAANERLAEQRPNLPALDQRCTEVGIDAVKSREHLVHLLFSHATYKSYPESFVTKGRWDRLLLWLDTVSASSVGHVDLADVNDIDHWIARLREAGYHLVVSSGTSGKNSFLLMTDEDVNAIHRAAVGTFAFPHRVEPDHARPCLMLGPGPAPMRYWYRFETYAAEYGRAGAIHTLGGEPLRVADMLRTAALRRAMADGTVTPNDLAAAEADEHTRRNQAEAAIDELADLMFGYRHEPQVVLGYWATWWRVLTAARERGLPDAMFHPESVAFIGGGLKGLSLPADYQEQMSAFLGNARQPTVYGMSELSTDCPMCEFGNYHVPPWLTLLVLDETGEHLQPEDGDGWTIGRAAFYDPIWNGRWGGIITGDKIRANYHATCSCGRSGTVIAGTITRYGENTPGGDDKLTCGGTIEQYIRGIVA